MSQSDINNSIDPNYRQPDWDYTHPQPPPQSIQNDENYGYNPYPPPPPRLPHSIWGISSIILAIFSAFVFCVTIGICVVLDEINPAYEGPTDVVAGLSVLASCFTQLVALVLGIIGVGQPYTNKTLAICGIVVSALSLMMIAGLVILVLC